MHTEAPTILLIDWQSSVREKRGITWKENSLEKEQETFTNEKTENHLSALTL